MGQLASVPSGAAPLRWRRNCPSCPAVPKHPNTHMMSQTKVMQVTAGAKGPQWFSWELLSWTVTNEKTAVVTKVELGSVKLRQDEFKCLFVNYLGPDLS